MDTWLTMFFLLMLSVGCTCTSDSTFPIYNEGDVAKLKFQYNSREIPVNETIQICRGNRLPFYIAGNISQAGLTDNEIGRFSVQEGYARGKEGNNIYLIVVTIQNVTSTDGGTYTCSVRKNGQILGELDQRIGLTVHFPPRKASCHFVDKAVQMNNQWTNLECTAYRGSYFGFFDCYQDDEKMPYLTRPTHNRTHIKQILLVKTNQAGMCCSTSYERPTERSACNDFFWFPLEGSTHQNIEEAIHVPTDKPNQQSTTPTKRSFQPSASVEVLTQNHSVNATVTDTVPYTNGITHLSLSLITIACIVLLCAIGIAIASKLYYRKAIKRMFADKSMSASNCDKMEFSRSINTI